METIGTAHRPRDLARFFQTEHGIGKRLGHRAALEKAEVATLIGRTGILRILLRQGRETGTVMQLGQQILRLLARLLHGRLVGVLGNGNEDMARPTLLGHRVRLLVLLIVLAQGCIRNLDGVRNGVARELEVGDLDLLGKLEGIRMPVVVGLDLLVGDLYPLLIPGERHHQVTDVASLGLEPMKRLRLRVGGEC